MDTHMKFLLSIAFFAALAFAQTKAKIVINVTDESGVVTSAKITGVPASAGLDTLTQFLATQVDCTGQPQVCTPRYDNAADLVKKHLIKLLEEIAPKFPSAQTKADVDEIDAKIAALAAKRKQLFDAARGEK
jgi:hypothetical protein